MPKSADLIVHTKLSLKTTWLTIQRYASKPHVILTDDITAQEWRWSFSRPPESTTAILTLLEGPQPGTELTCTVKMRYDGDVTIEAQPRERGGLFSSFFGRAKDGAVIARQFLDDLALALNQNQPTRIEKRQPTSGPARLEISQYSFDGKILNISAEGIAIVLSNNLPNVNILQDNLTATLHTHENPQAPTTRTVTIAHVTPGKHGIVIGFRTNAISTARA